jgi:glutamine cyclotransferase
VRLAVFFLAFFFFCALATRSSAAWAAAPVYKAKIAAEFAHDPQLFTQGLFFQGESLVESAGLYGQSKIRRYRLDGEVLAELALGPKFFAEGAALANGAVYLLTWLEGVVFLLDPQTLAVKETKFTPAESWGLAFDGDKLWRSDGSARLWPHRLDLSSAGPPVTVRDGRRPIRFLNELEHDPKTGLILANIFGEPKVAFVDPQDGQVRFFLDCRELFQKTAPRDPQAVMNGLALDGEGRLYLTGKLWPKLYRVEWSP